MNDLSFMRRDYDKPPLKIDSLLECPFKQFEQWFVHATNRIREPNAMVLSTVEPNGRPTLRSLLLKSYDESGFVFFSNYKSRKAVQIEGNENVAILFPWYSCQWQVEINGRAMKLTNAESLKYFALRPRGNQLGSWVSQQSAVVSSRGLLLNRLNELQEKFAEGDIPMPPSWGGYRIVPDRFEFWQGGRDRIHDRFQYLKCDEQKDWSLSRLSP